MFFDCLKRLADSEEDTELSAMAHALGRIFFNVLRLECAEARFPKVGTFRHPMAKLQAIPTLVHTYMYIGFFPGPVRCPHRVHPSPITNLESLTTLLPVNMPRVARCQYNASLSNVTTD